jgi:hypothetical protein
MYAESGAKTERNVRVEAKDVYPNAAGTTTGSSKKRLTKQGIANDQNLERT